ncbi:MAG: radical SAM protein [Bacteroidetes bacterium]|nr:radical SAM protein [Bacteroidota bacterium]
MSKRVEVKTILNKTKRRDPFFLDDYTTNPYSACAYNCLFCYIRGSKYGEHMDSSLAIKTNAPALLDKQLALRARKNQFGFIVLSSATEPYQKAEQHEKITRSMLEIILKHRFPVHIITRSDLVLRDRDLLKSIGEKAILPPDLQKLNTGTLITFSFSTLHDPVAKIFEPGACPPSKRLDAVAEMKAAGFKTGISLMPLLPYISDTTAELELFFSTFKTMRVDYVMPSSITLFGNEKGDSKTLVLNAVNKHYPHLSEKYERFFAVNQNMPASYQAAFAKKMAELKTQYQLNDRIV